MISIYLIKKDQLNQLQKSISETPGTTDTIVSENDKIDEPSLFFCQDSREPSDLVNHDLELSNLTTSNSPKEIWQNLNKRCVDKFGDKDCVTNNTTAENITWAHTTLPAYLSWDVMKCHYDDIKKWIVKIKQFCNDESEIVTSDEKNGTEKSEYNEKF